MYDIPFDRSFFQLSNGIRHMPSTDKKLELTAKASMAQSVSQTTVCSNGLIVILKADGGAQGPKHAAYRMQCRKYSCVGR